MKFYKIDYKIESYITSVKKQLTEKDIKRFYENLNYNVYINYQKRLVEGKWYIKDNFFKIKELFEEYNSGYPDFLLVHTEDKSKIKFVEIKLDADALRPNQIEFNNKLSKVADVTIAYFHNKKKYVDPDDIISIRRFTNEEKLLLERLENLYKIKQAKGLKSLWVVAKLYENYGTIVLRKNVVGLIASKIHEKRGKIVWFVKNQLLVN